MRRAEREEELEHLEEGPGSRRKKRRRRCGGVAGHDSSALRSVFESYFAALAEKMLCFFDIILLNYQ